MNKPSAVAKLSLLPLLAALMPLAASGQKSEGASKGEYSVLPSATYRPSNDLTLWYVQPATATRSTNQWMEYSLPIGNGHFGASLMNGIATDEIQFNDKTLWSGGPEDYGYYLNFGSLLIDTPRPTG